MVKVGEIDVATKFKKLSGPEDEVEGGLLLDVVVREGPSVFELLASKDQPLLVRGDAFLVLKRSH